MVGGGSGSFIGKVHRHAMALDGLYKLVAGVFSRDSAKSAAFGATLGIGESRLYTSYAEMCEAELKLPEDERMQVVVIVTPTPDHAFAVKTFAAAGFNVVCDKPLCSNMQEADEVLACLEKHQSSKFMLIHNYSGYPMIKQAKCLVSDGDLGDIKKVVVEYEQGWVCESVGLSSTEGISTLADVGTHALQLLEYVTGLHVESVCADVATMVGGPRSPDDANILLRLDGGRRGVLIASQASAGMGNGLRLRVFGSKAGMLWEQEHPEQLHFMPVGAPAQKFVRGGAGLRPLAIRASRIPGGHPEGFMEAFANLYKDFQMCCHGSLEIEPDFPTAKDGRHLLAFVEACMRSSEIEQWVKV